MILFLIYFLVALFRWIRTTQAEGSGHFLKTGGGKDTMHILPLYDEIATPPLLHDAMQFEKMPKAGPTCGENYSSGDYFDVYAEALIQNSNFTE